MKKGMVKPRTYGRMGNFLFQAATAMSYAWDHGLEFTLPNTTSKPLDNPIYLQHLVNPAWNPSLPERVVEEQRHSFQPLPAPVPGHNTILDGYWQSEKYFKHHRDRVIDAFGFRWESCPGTVSVHVRRGDYLILTKKHPPVPKEWIEQAMSLFPGAVFRFFSDDIAWCKAEFGHLSWVSFSEGGNEVSDLVEMSYCEHHICSASTFSWWGAWLNRNPHKQVVMPRLWFQPGRKEDTSDIVPLEWRRL